MRRLCHRVRSCPGQPKYCSSVLFSGESTSDRERSLWPKQYSEMNPRAKCCVRPESDERPGEREGSSVSRRRSRRVAAAGGCGGCEELEAATGVRPETKSRHRQKQRPPCLAPLPSVRAHAITTRLLALASSRLFSLHLHLIHSLFVRPRLKTFRAAQPSQLLFTLYRLEVLFLLFIHSFFNPHTLSFTSSGSDLASARHSFATATPIIHTVYTDHRNQVTFGFQKPCEFSHKALT